jgi:hypothetical protein
MVINSMASETLTTILNFASETLKLLLGDPATRTARFMIVVGVGLISVPWWQPFLEFIFVSVFSLSDERVNFAQDPSPYNGWALILIGIAWIVLQRRTAGSTPVGFWVKFLTALVGQKLLVVLASLFGAFGMLNLLDSLIVVYWGSPWRFLDTFALWFFLFKTATRFFFEFFSIFLSFSIPTIVQDYLAMGIIVMGMRLRSSRVIRKAIKNEELDEYNEEFMGLDLTVNNESTILRWFAFFFLRLSFAVFFWPFKLFGASKRYIMGNLRNRGRGQKQTEIQSMQYLTFFGTVAWALVILIQLLVIKAVTF